mmetsp:Transcript_54174/g.61289  ORF Transcript_54174/g.61289 Transcript_54174/m.61289 type:complete len:452 (+) Transcript_54174:96-1451(+)
MNTQPSLLSGCAPSSSSCRVHVLGMVLFACCSTILLVEAFQGSNKNHVVHRNQACGKTNSIHGSLFLAKLPTATAIEDVIATGDEDGAIAEVMQMTDVTSSSKKKTTATPTATSMTDVLTDGEVTAVEAAQKPGRLRRIWNRIYRGKKKTKKKTETTKTNDIKQEQEEETSVASPSSSVETVINKDDDTKLDEENKPDTNSNPTLVGDQGSTIKSSSTTTPDSAGQDFSFQRLRNDFEQNKTTNTPEEEASKKKVPQTIEEKKTVVIDTKKILTSLQSSGEGVPLSYMLEDDSLRPTINDVDDITIEVGVEQNLEEKEKKKKQIVTTGTTPVDENKKKGNTAALQQQQQQQKEKKERSGATAAAAKLLKKEQAAATATGLAERRAITRQKIEAKAAAKAAKAMTMANKDQKETNKLSASTSSSSFLNEMEEETRNGIIVIALLGVLWLANV